MDCPDATSLRMLLDGELDDRREQEVASHVDGCPSCQRALSDAEDPSQLDRWRALSPELPGEEPTDPPGSGSGGDRTEPRGGHPDTGTPGGPVEPPEIPGFELLRPLGSGGMGMVFEAVRVADYRRRVAVKLIRRGLVTDEALRRFRAEVQALAELGAHPSIAALFDAGTTASGEPFLVMEYVEGSHIDAFCDASRLGIAQRVGLFLQVCDAVQHAHRHAVLHRDLKPQNILVARDGTPKLIDFGIAKLLDRDRAAEVSLASVTGGLAMTPSYASPEQLRGEPLTTASDVYALGVVLYELLAGRRPYELTGRSFGEVERLVCEQEPPRPSLAVPRLPDASAVCEARLETPAGLRRRLQGDLDTIVMMALRKEPARRYASVEQLAADLRRSLEHRPVLARRDSVGYRLGRFARRNRAAVVAAALLLITLVGGIVGTTAGMIWALRERDRADHGFRQAKRAVDELLTEVSENELLNLPYMLPVSKRLLEASLPYYRDFVSRSGEDPGLLGELAEAHRRLALIDELTGDRARAVEHYQVAVDTWRKVLVDDPDAFTPLLELSSALSDLGLFQSEMEGMAEAAEANFREAIAIQEGLVARAPEATEPRRRLGNALGNLALLLGNRGDPAAAASLLRRSIRIGEGLVSEQPDVVAHRFELATKRSDLASFEFFFGLDPDAGLEGQRRAVALFEEIVQERPAVPDYAHQLARCLSNLALMSRLEGRPEEARAMIDDALPAFERITQAYPSVVAYETDHAIALNMLCDLQRAAGELDAALESTDRARAIEERVVRAYPREPEYRVNLSKSYNNIGRIEQARGNDAEALAGYRRAAELLEGIEPLSPPNRYNLACNLSLCVPVAGDPGLSERFATGALEALRRAAGSGYLNVDLFEGDSDLDPIRGRSEYAALIESLQPDAPGH